MTPEAGADVRTGGCAHGTATTPAPPDSVLHGASPPTPSCTGRTPRHRPVRGEPPTPSCTGRAPRHRPVRGEPFPRARILTGRKPPPGVSGRACPRPQPRRQQAGGQRVAGAWPWAEPGLRAPPENSDSRLTHLKASSLSLLSFSPSFTLSSSLCKSTFAWSSCFTSRLNTQNQRHFGGC